MVTALMACPAVSLTAVRKNASHHSQSPSVRIICETGEKETFYFLLTVRQNACTAVLPGCKKVRRRP